LLPELVGRKFFGNKNYFIDFFAKISTDLFTNDKVMDYQRKAEAIANHRLNMANSLRHRMEVARAKNDSHLVSLLEQEMRQLGLTNQI